MKKRITTYDVKLVKEESKLYELDSTHDQLYLRRWEHYPDSLPPL